MSPHNRVCVSVVLFWPGTETIVSVGSTPLPLRPDFDHIDLSALNSWGCDEYNPPVKQKFLRVLLLFVIRSGFLMWNDPLWLSVVWPTATSYVAADFEEFEGNCRSPHSAFSGTWPPFCPLVERKAHTQTHKSLDAGLHQLPQRQWWETNNILPRSCVKPQQSHHSCSAESEKSHREQRSFCFYTYKEKFE